MIKAYCKCTALDYKREPVMQEIIRPSLQITVFTGLCLVLAVLFTGCQVTAPVPEETAPAGTAQLSPLPVLPVKDARHYTVDPVQSEIRILVFRGGPLAKFGHNHVMRVKKISGDVYLAPALRDSAFIFSFPVKAIDIDPAQARAEEGEEFSTPLSPQAIEGTRKNMLGPEVLDAENFPDIMIRSVNLSGNESEPAIRLQITLHGVTREYTVPTMVRYSERHLAVTGMLGLRTTDFNMTPFSVMGGGLQVQDEVKIRFSIAAEETG